MSNSEVKQEFELFGKILATKHQELEKTCLRKLEHQAYLSAAKCTENNSLGTYEVRNCIKSSFDKVEQAHKIVAEKQAQLGEAMNGCQKNCENNIVLEAPNGPASLPDLERENLQKKFYNCIIECPKKTIPLVEEAFKNLASTLGSLK